MPPKERAHQWHDNNICKSVVLEIADKVLTKKNSRKIPRRDVSQKTWDLFAKRQKMSKRNSTKSQFKDIQKQIKESYLQDFHTWVDTCAEEIEDTNKLGDVRRVYHLVKQLGNKPKPPSSNYLGSVP